MGRRKKKARLVTGRKLAQVTKVALILTIHKTGTNTLFLA